MLSSVKLTDKSDVVNFIIFKRQIRRQLKKMLMCLYIVLIIGLVSCSLYYKNNIVDVGNSIANACFNVVDDLFKTKIEKVSIHIEENSILDANEIDNIVKRIVNRKIDRRQMKEIAKVLKETNSLIDNVYIKKTMINNSVDVFVKEKQIIAVIFSNDCISAEFCRKALIAKDNSLVSYHYLKNTNNLLKIYGDVSSADVYNVYMELQKYNLFKKINYVKFFTSGRFDMMFNNGMVVKIPYKNWKEMLSEFVKNDSEFALTNDIRKIKSMDLRTPDKIYIEK